MADCAKVVLDCLMGPASFSRVRVVCFISKGDTSLLFSDRALLKRGGASDTPPPLSPGGDKFNTSLLSGPQRAVSFLNLDTYISNRTRTRVKLFLKEQIGPHASR